MEYDLNWSCSMQEFLEESPAVHVLSHAMSTLKFQTPKAVVDVPEDPTIPHRELILRDTVKARSKSDIAGFKEARLLSIVETHPYYLHFIIYRADLTLLRQLFTLQPSNILAIVNERDHRGNTPLTLATKLSHLSPNFYSIIRMLLSKGADPKGKDAYGWSALDEAVSKGDRDLVGLLFDALHAAKMRKWTAAKEKAVAALQQLPDFSMEFKWEFDSSVIPLVSKIAPHDVCRIWKSGSQLRLDMTLVGWKKLRSKRRNVSLVFNTTDHEADLYLINHSKKMVVRPLEPLDMLEREAVLDDILQASAVQGDLSVRQSTITPVHGWTGKPVCSKVAQWRCSKLEVQLLGAVNYVTRGKGHLLLREREYFARMTSRASKPVLPSPLPRHYLDEVLEDPVDYSHLPGSTHKEDSQYQATRKGKLILWVTREFPLPLRDFLPVLEMLAPGNPTIQRMHEFLTSAAFQTHFSADMFPVRLELPLNLTIKGLVTFTKMELGRVSPALMLIPDYAPVSRREGQKTLTCPRKRLLFANFAV